MGRIGAEPAGDIARRESGLTSAWCLITREFGKTPEGARQMTGARRAGRQWHLPKLLVRLPADEWNWSQIDWNRAEKNVRRLQARIVKAAGEGRWGKVRCLQSRRQVDGEVVSRPVLNGLHHVYERAA
jgi:hypothetical protein